MSTKIEWTKVKIGEKQYAGDTWNPTIGCSKVSAGCENCYAIRMAWRLMHSPNKGVAEKYKGTVLKTEGGKLNWTGQINLLDEVLLKPAKTKTPTAYFVDSMSDLFHEKVPFEYVDKVIAIVALCPQHIFQVLTKRSDHMLKYFKSREDNNWRHIEEAAEILACENAELFYELETYHDINGRNTTFPSNKLLPHIIEAGWSSSVNYVSWDDSGDYDKEHEFIYEGKWPLPNLWLGVSVEEQKQANRIITLTKVPAAVRFLSCEPLINYVSLLHILDHPTAKGKIHQVICGGESGPDARPMHPYWARMLRDQCEKFDISFFFKQWGAWKPIEKPKNPVLLEGYVLLEDGRLFKNNEKWPDNAGVLNFIDMENVGKKAAGRLLDGKEHNGYPKNIE